VARPYYQDSAVTIYRGDCREILPTLGMVDLVFTDPPYNVRAEDIALDGRAPMKRDFGLWDEGWSARAFCASVLPLVRNGGSMLSFTSDRLLSDFRTAAGWTPRGTIVWDKMNPAPSPRPGYVSAVEYVVWLQKPGMAATWNASGYTPNIMRCPICAGSERTQHPTQKPESLIAELVARHSNPGDLILDPFMGSGTTLVAAKRLGRRAIGIELNQAYCDIAVRRLAQSVLPLEQAPAPVQAAMFDDTDAA
jgi:site-specific DNA-methyltransferase (adenine-specific)